MNRAAKFSTMASAISVAGGAAMQSLDTHGEAAFQLFMLGGMATTITQDNSNRPLSRLLLRMGVAALVGAIGLKEAALGIGAGDRVQMDAGEFVAGAALGEFVCDAMEIGNRVSRRIMGTDPSV